MPVYDRLKGAYCFRHWLFLRFCWACLGYFSCFAVREKTTQSYLKPNILKWYYKSPYERQGDGTNGERESVELPEKAEERGDYRAAIEGIDSEEYDPPIPKPKIEKPARFYSPIVHWGHRW
jgi:hypothetical protein